MDPRLLHDLLFKALEEAAFPSGVESFVNALNDADRSQAAVRLEVTWSGAKFCFGPKDLLGKTPPRMLPCRTGTAAWWYASAQPDDTKRQAAEAALTRLVNVLLHQEERAGTDWLTRLPNRLAMDHFRRHREPGRWHWIALADIDRMREVNEGEGYTGGDRAIRETAESMDAGLAGDGLLFRIGGDEFLIVLSCREASEALAILDRVLTAPDPGRSVSMGAVRLEDNLDQALDHAARTLLAAKKHGRSSLELDAGPA